MMQQTISSLRQNFTRPLPGQAAQFKMAPAPRRSNMTAPDGVFEAAVLALIYPKEEVPHLVLIERTGHNRRDRHRGQISLPGGRAEEDDGSFERTALRETQEEVGVNAEDVEILGKLSPLYIPVSNFQVYPYVGYVDYEPQWIPQESEVESIIEVPLNHFQDTSNHHTKDMNFSANLLIREVPYFDVAGRTVWGATAMILSELVEILDSVNTA